MKVKVINKFRDKNTDLLQDVGTEIEVTQKRFDEINSTAFGVFLEELKKETKKSTKKKKK